MDLLKKLERTFGRFAIRNFTPCLIAGQVGAYVLISLGRLQPGDFLFVPRLVLGGEPWRLLTFLFLPPPSGVLFIAFAWWLFYLMGSALEGHWGAFRYNLFLLSGWLLTVGVAWFQPDAPVQNYFIAGSVFLAFARLYPDFELAIFFILPVKIKWLALFTWVGYGYSLVVGGWSARLQILAATGNFLLFFGHDLWLTVRMRERKMKLQAEEFAHANDARHRCHTCGKTDLNHPDLDFRYCSKCAGDECYCPEHISQHEHVPAKDGDAPKP
ncbi:MAG: rhomboid family intramembrane serine protease [Verrucomicrobiota bacterium]